LAIIVVVAAGTTFGVLNACDSRTDSNAASSPADQTYTVRGRVVELANPATNHSLQIHHERIPTFVGKSGEITGMKEMVMEFAWIAPGAAPADLTVGDAIEMTFEVRWKTEPRTLVTKLVRLAPETALDLQTLSDPS
jgi:hypothetical protein